MMYHCFLETQLGCDRKSAGEGVLGLVQLGAGVISGRPG